MAFIRVNQACKYSYWHIIVVVLSISQFGCGPGNKKPIDKKLKPEIVYYMPKATFDVEVEYRLKKCGNFKEIKIRPKAKVTPHIKADTNKPYTYNFIGNASASQEHDVAISLYPIGTLKTVNATSTDKTGDIITNVFTGIGNLFGIGALFGADKSGTLGFDINTKKEDLSELCNDVTRKYLKEIKTLKAAIAGYKKSVTELEPNKGKPSIDQYNAYSMAVNAAADRIVFINKNYLTITTKKKGIVPSKGGEPLQLDLKVLNKWFFDDVNKNTKICSDMSMQLTLSMPVDVEEPSKNVNVAVDDNSVREQRVHYVVPAKTLLKISPLNGGKPILSMDASIPQWGAHKEIDFTVSVFESKSVGYEFSESGDILKINVKTNAKGAAAASAFASSTGALKGAVDTALYGKDVAEAAILDRETKFYENKVKLINAKEAYEKALAEEAD